MLRRSGAPAGNLRPSGSLADRDWLAPGRQTGGTLVLAGGCSMAGPLLAGWTGGQLGRAEPCSILGNSNAATSRPEALVFEGQAQLDCESVRHQAQIKCASRSPQAQRRCATVRHPAQLECAGVRRRLGYRVHWASPDPVVQGRQTVQPRQPGRQGAASAWLALHEVRLHHGYGGTHMTPRNAGHVSVRPWTTPGSTSEQKWSSPGHVSVRGSLLPGHVSVREYYAKSRECVGKVATKSRECAQDITPSVCGVLHQVTKSPECAQQYYTEAPEGARVCVTRSSGTCVVEETRGK